MRNYEKETKKTKDAHGNDTYYDLIFYDATYDLLCADRDVDVTVEIEVDEGVISGITVRDAGTYEELPVEEEEALEYAEEVIKAAYLRGAEMVANYAA